MTKALVASWAIDGLRCSLAVVALTTNCAPDLAPAFVYFWPRMSVPTVAGAWSLCQTTTKLLLLAHEIEGCSGTFDFGGVTTCSAASGTPAADSRRIETP